MAELVYALCALTSLGCALLLWKGFRRQRSRLLFWSSSCFGLLAVNNVLLFADLAVAHTYDLSVVRAVTGVAAVAVMLFGLVWDTETGS
jgi:hypothetical protein